MGNGAASGSERSFDEIEAEVKQLTRHLPIAELLNGGIIQLKGLMGYFNVDSILEPSWLKGKITLDEFRSAIEYINKCTIAVQMNSPRLFSRLALHQVEKAKAAAGTAAVEKINRQHKSIRFTYQQGIENMRFYPIWDPGLHTNLTYLADGTISKGPISYIYVNIN